MTSSASFSGNSFNAINLSPSSDKKLQSDIEELESLFKEKIFLSNETTDCQGNRSRLWVLKNGMFFGMVFTDGKISFIPSNKIINSCTNNLLSSENLKRLKGLQIDFTYIPEQKKLIVFPHLRAAGKEDQI